MEKPGLTFEERVCTRLRRQSEEGSSPGASKILPGSSLLNYIHLLRRCPPPGSPLLPAALVGPSRACREECSLAHAPRPQPAKTSDATTADFPRSRLRITPQCCGAECYTHRKLPHPPSPAPNSSTSRTCHPERRRPSSKACHPERVRRRRTKAKDLLFSDPRTGRELPQLSYTNQFATRDERSSPHPNHRSITAFT